MSVFVQYCPYKLAEASGLREAQAFATPSSIPLRGTVRTSGLILHAEIRTPHEIEPSGLTEGNIFQAS